jgi:hypothetical protein
VTRRRRRLPVRWCRAAGRIDRLDAMVIRHTKGDAFDPKGLIAESYLIEGITAAECRTIFLDWALSFEGDAQAGLEVLLARVPDADHPMTQVLTAGLEAQARPRRRGGWRSRPRDPAGA